jgi:hypothetical protein
MEIEYEHLEKAKRGYEETGDKYEADCPIHHFRLPGGINLFMRGYEHNPEWQKRHGEYLRIVNQHDQIIAIEGFTDAPFGESLELRWSSESHQKGNYGVLMKNAVEDGSNNCLFKEVDARDMSKISMDPTIMSLLFIPVRVFPDLPHDFFENYFEFLKREHTSLANIIGSPEKLSNILMLQSATI